VDVCAGSSTRWRGGFETDYKNSGELVLGSLKVKPFCGVHAVCTDFRIDEKNILLSALDLPHYRSKRLKGYDEVGAQSLRRLRD
jgi:hypothetical protein